MRRQYCPYQLLVNDQWTNLREGTEVEGGRLVYLRRTGARGIAEPGEWRKRTFLNSGFVYTPLAQRPFYARWWVGLKKFARQLGG